MTTYTSAIRPSQLLTAGQVAERLQVSAGTVRKPFDGRPDRPRRSTRRSIPNQGASQMTLTLAAEGLGTVSDIIAVASNWGWLFFVTGFVTGFWARKR